MYEYMFIKVEFKKMKKDRTYYEDMINNLYQEIWHNEVFDPIRTYKVDSKICRDCNYNIFCNGGCFANKVIKHGEFSKEADKNCFRIRGIYA